MISPFMLERYKLGELDIEDKKKIKEELSVNIILNQKLQDLLSSDEQLLCNFPCPDFSVPARKKSVFSFPVYLRIAALVIAAIMFPVIIIVNNFNKPIEGPDRIKGVVQDGYKFNVFLDGASDRPLADFSVLPEGCTVQLEYAVPAGYNYYGYIFSVDGRSVITIHYPYERGQSSMLVSGKPVLLSEAYILDDAPDYEVFIMVLSRSDFGTGVINIGATEICKKIYEVFNNKTEYFGNIAKVIEREGKSIFPDCDIKTVIVLKK